MSTGRFQTEGFAQRRWKILVGQGLKVAGMIHSYI